MDAAAALATAKAPAPKRQKKAKPAIPADSGERRVSSREKKAINYSEMEARGLREPKAPVDYTERIKVWARAGRGVGKHQQHLCEPPAAASKQHKQAADARTHRVSPLRSLCLCLSAQTPRASPWTRTRQSSCARTWRARRQAAAAAGPSLAARSAALWTRARACASRCDGDGAAVG